jgi:hypothetical protein
VVWRPNGVDCAVALTLAIGQVDMRYAIEYHDYRRADVRTKVTVR